MSVAFSSSKEILSFHELERRKMFIHNKRLLRTRLAAMEREIHHLTAEHEVTFRRKGPAEILHISSQKIILTEEEEEQQRNWPRDIDTQFEKELVDVSQGKYKSIKTRNKKRRMRRSASTPNTTTTTTNNNNNNNSTTTTGEENYNNNNGTGKESVNGKRRMGRKTLPPTTSIKRQPKLVPIGGGLGPRFPRPVLAGVTNGPTPQDYTLPGLFGSHPGGEMVQTFAWDETRDRDWFQEGAFWDQRMKALANERKASMLARKEAAKKTQSRRLKQQAKDELVNADQTDRRQKYHPRKWFLKQLEGGETLSFQFIKAGQLGAQTKQTFGRT